MELSEEDGTLHMNIVCSINRLHFKAKQSFLDLEIQGDEFSGVFATK